VAVRRRDERGLSESISYAVIWPALLLVTVGIIQAGIWVHGHNVAVRAAQAAADVTRGSYGSAEEARQVAYGIARSGGLSGVDVDVASGAGTVQVTVSGDAPFILDLSLGRITESASVPLERVSSP
jgi:Flp pilus assembly protein TadG